MSDEEEQIHHYEYMKQQDKIVSDGKATAYYDFPIGATTLNDLIEYKDMSFARGNIFKAAYRLGEKAGIEEEYDLNKIIYYAERLLNRLKKKRKKQKTKKK